MAAILFMASPGSCLATPQSVVHAKQASAIERANSLYDAGLRALAQGEYDKASDDFNRAMMAARVLLGKGELTQQEEANLRTLAVKSEHLATQAFEKISLLSYTAPASEVKSQDMSSYVGYDSTQVAAGPARTDAKLPAVTLEMNQKVKKWVEFYVKDGGKLFLRWLNRSSQYMGLVQTILEREGVPGDLAYLVLVESGFNLQARSWAHAVGPWQFILGTARLFDLKVDPWIDERYDPETSTIAAARYLKHLYSLFGSWPLAIAAYNGGEGLVNRALQRQNTRDFWSLRLPRQTEEYVPQFMAALHIAREPEKYGLYPEASSAVPFEELVVYGPVDMRKMAQICSASPDCLKLLNPSFKRSKTPARRGGIKVRVPAGTAGTYASALSQDGIRSDRSVAPGEVSYEAAQASTTLPQDGFAGPPIPEAVAPDYSSTPAEEELYLTYRVRKGDSLHRISRNFGVSVQDIEEFNDIARGKIIKPGQKLLIPRDGVKLAEDPSDKHVRRSAKLTHIVRSGETLYGISKSYGVSVGDLTRWNDLPSRRLIRPGQKLLVYPDQEPEPTQATTQADGR